MCEIVKTVRLPYTVWKKLMQYKLDGGFESMSALIESMLEKEGY